ncbi:MAG TPA: antibiotic biosynthesis monooxygenase [Candidatus Acidoferrum sp.]|nr:antibiotic biosynthesis monooxygenase [Candidatus Acidoferrum sp.]
MFVALWEYEVKPGGEQRFEKAYGPDGDWVRLFRSDTHYYQTRLVRDSLRRGVYLTMDFWESRAAYQEFMSAHQAEYKQIDTRGEALTVKERRIGWFEMVE